MDSTHGVALSKVVPFFALSLFPILVVAQLSNPPRCCDLAQGMGDRTAADQSKDCQLHTGKLGAVSATTLNGLSKLSNRAANRLTNAIHKADFVRSLTKDWWGKVHDNFHQYEYYFKPKPLNGLPTIEAEYQAPNRAHALRSLFNSRGFVVTQRAGAETNWQLGLSLIGYGYEGTVQPVEPVQPIVHENTVEYRRCRMTEWYINDSRGLEQGFTLTEPPALTEGGLTDRVVLEFAVSGDLSVSFNTSREIVEFSLPGSGVVLHMGALYAFDSTGRRLKSEFDMAGERLAVRVQTGDAVYPIVIDPLLTSPFFTADGDQDNAEFGFSVSTAGDVNGDGYDDVIVGAPKYDSGKRDAGRVVVYYGGPEGLSSSASWIVDGDDDYAEFGYSVASAGDVNKDGYSDIIIGAPRYEVEVGLNTSERGRVFVYHGGAEGLAETPSWTADGTEYRAALGYSVAMAGDVNDDGYGDVILGAPEVGNSQGMATLYLGGPVGLDQLPAWSVEGSHGHYGSSVATAGDVNGDGYDDVIVGAPYYDCGYYDEDLYTELDQGRAFVYHGGSDGLAQVPDWTGEHVSWAAVSNRGYGRSAAWAGDVNGDGYSDVIVGEPMYTEVGEPQEGRVLVYPGGPLGLAKLPERIIEGDGWTAYFGWAVATAGDVNGDGYSDVSVGAKSFRNGELSEGKAFVFYGHPDGLVKEPAWTFEGNQEDAFLGYSVGTAGDVDGDGYSDLIIGSPGYDNNFLDEGRVFAFRGPLTPAITDPEPRSILSSPQVQFDWSSFEHFPTGWQLHIGSTAGSLDVHDSGVLDANTISTIVSLPGEGGKIHVRLWFEINGEWQFSDFDYLLSSDADGDGVLDGLDSCPDAENAGQGDTDMDGIGDVCDLDNDNDGLPNEYELDKGLNPLDYRDADSDPDSDSFIVLEEYLANSDPWSTSSTPVSVPLSFKQTDFTGRWFSYGYWDWVNTGTDDPGWDSCVYEVNAVGAFESGKCQRSRDTLYEDNNYLIEWLDWPLTDSAAVVAPTGTVIPAGPSWISAPQVDDLLDFGYKLDAGKTVMVGGSAELRNGGLYPNIVMALKQGAGYLQSDVTGIWHSYSYMDTTFLGANQPAWSGSQYNVEQDGSVEGYCGNWLIISPDGEVMENGSDQFAHYSSRLDAGKSVLFGVGGTLGRYIFVSVKEDEKSYKQNDLTGVWHGYAISDSSGVNDPGWRRFELAIDADGTILMGTEEDSRGVSRELSGALTLSDFGEVTLNGEIASNLIPVEGQFWMDAGKTVIAGGFTEMRVQPSGLEAEYPNLMILVKAHSTPSFDIDGDGVEDELDNCPSTANPKQDDSDSDRVGDVCDTDDDNDGVVDTEDVFPLNPDEWLDTDMDGTGNNADIDDDNDGLPDNLDGEPLIPLTNGCSSDVVIIQSYTYSSGENLLCEATISIATEGAVTVADGAAVVYVAPLITFRSGFRVQNGAVLVAKIPE